MSDPVTLTVGEHTATFDSAHDAIVALLESLPRKQRNALVWMDVLRRINQREAGINPTGVVGEKAVTSVRG